MKLTPKQRAYLKGLAHEKKPVILIGNKGITEPVLKETRGALLTHELIKVRLGEGSADLDQDAQRIAGATGSALVDRIGRMAILYKRRPEKPTIVLPKAPKANAPSVE